MKNSSVEILQQPVSRTEGTIIQQQCEAARGGLGCRKQLAHKTANSIKPGKSCGEDCLDFGEHWGEML